MTSVPEAGLFPRTPLPVRCMNGSITSKGKPCGYVGIGCGVTKPISSQWPVIVSLPLERSSSRPATAGAPGCGGHPSSGATLPRPRASMLGRSSPPTARATFPSVLDPSSPNLSASGSAPAPTPSSTMTHARDMGLLYLGLVDRLEPARSRPVHRRDHRDRRRDDLGRRQALPAEDGAGEGRREVVAVLGGSAKCCESSGRVRRVVRGHGRRTRSYREFGRVRGHAPRAVPRVPTAPSYFAEPSYTGESGRTSSSGA